MSKDSVRLYGEVDMTDIVQDRKIDNPPVPNLRDLGNLPVAGGTFKPREVYRSVDLAGLKIDEFSAFEALGVKTVYDLRTTTEMTASPDNLPSDVKLVHLDVLADASTAAAASESSLLSGSAEVEQMLGGGKAEQEMIETYRQLVSLPSALASYREYFESLADPTRQGAVLFHCTTGKDRTGWAAAALLTLLGADKDTVYADYIETNTDIVAFTGPMYAQAKAAGIDPSLLEPVLTVKKVYLDTAFEEVNAKFGSFDTYIRQGLGVSDDLIATLRQRFVIPT